MRTPWMYVPWPGLIAVTFAGCQLGGARSFPPAEPALEAENRQAGDPHGGRFPLADALAGLPEGQHLEAVIDTDAGAIFCALDLDVPLVVANFVGLARGLRPFQSQPGAPWQTAPFYDGLEFHRAVPNQFIQTGRRGESEDPGFHLQDEMSSGHVFDRGGLLALANTGAPNSGAAQFFITTGPLRHLDGEHTIFGTCDDEAVVRELERRILADPNAPPRLRSLKIRRRP
ncbi:MAG: peptidylprolyl isomerase [Nannocystis sp.]|nr:peptidylprolyl isomerase [Nannocystis sp.]MBA3547329.1 peptidylprolyl isomerase [Nannocystis sp.]